MNECLSTPQHKHGGGGGGGVTWQKTKIAHVQEITVKKMCNLI